MSLDLGLGLDRVSGVAALRFGKAIIERGAAGVSSHQPSLSSRRGSREGLKLTMMIFPMIRAWGPHWQG